MARWAASCSWYSIIHASPGELPAYFAEFARVLASGGHLLAAFFESGGEPAAVFDHKVAPAVRWPIDELAALAGGAGHAEVGRMLREPREQERFCRGALAAAQVVGRLATGRGMSRYENLPRQLRADSGPGDWSGRRSWETTIRSTIIRPGDGSPCAVRDRTHLEAVSRKHRDTEPVIAQIASRQPRGRDGAAGATVTIWTPTVSRQRPGC
jgi:hypothetical protein